MIPYDLDPSLHSGAPEAPKLDDGFSPPQPGQPVAPLAPLPGGRTVAQPPVDPVLSAQSEV